MREHMYKNVSLHMRGGGLLTLPGPGSLQSRLGRVTRRNGQTPGLLDRVSRHGKCEKVDCCDTYSKIR